MKKFINGICVEISGCGEPLFLLHGNGETHHIFEEAAGISKFRYQRNEAERKLDKANQNLTVANERIAEIERQILPLRKQAETAKKYFELKDLLKIQEVNLYITEAVNFE